MSASTSLVEALRISVVPAVALTGAQTEAMARHYELLLRWNGHSWRVQHTALNGLTALLNSLSAVSATDIWAAGGGPTSDKGTLGTGVLAHYSCNT
jgi:hypothetical protein